jgi:hypothetical protein
MNFQAMREFCRLIRARELRKICILPHHHRHSFRATGVFCNHHCRSFLAMGQPFLPLRLAPTPGGLGNLPLPSFNCVSTQGEERTLSTRLAPFRHQGSPSSSFVWPRFDTRRRGFSPLVWPHFNTRKTGNPALPPIWPRFDTRRRGESSFPLSAAFRHLKDAYPSSPLVWPHFDIRAAPCPSPFGRVSTPGGVSLILPHFDTPRTGNHLFGPISIRRRDNRPRLTRLKYPPLPSF